MRVVKLDHVQLAMPAGHEDRARGFYSGLLGIPEVQKPDVLARRGGVWFEQAMARRLRDAGVEVVDDDSMPGRERVYVADPFGNRLELIEAGKYQMREERQAGHC